MSHNTNNKQQPYTYDNRIRKTYNSRIIKASCCRKQTTVERKYKDIDIYSNTKKVIH